MISRNLSREDKAKILADYCKGDPHAAARLERLGVLALLGQLNVISDKHAPVEPKTKHDLARHGVPKEVIETLEYANRDHPVAAKLFAWQRGDGIRGRAYGLLLHGPGKGKSVAACMAIDPRFIRNTGNHTKLCVAEGTLLALEMRKDSAKDLARYERAHTLVVDSVGQSGMHNRSTYANVADMLRRRWSEQRYTILTSRADLAKLEKVYGESWVTIQKYCHMVEAKS